MREQKKAYNRPAYFIGAAAMLVIMFVGPYVVPAWSEEITQTGVAVSCVFVGAIVGILTTNDLIMCGLFSMGGLVVNGILTSGEVVASFMGASYVWQIMVLYALCYVIVRDKTGEAIAHFLLTRKFTQKYPIVMLMVLFFALGLASAFMGVFGALIVGFTLVDGIFTSAGIDKKTRFARLVYLGTFVMICVGPMTIGSMAALNPAAGQFFLSIAGVQVITFRFVAEAFVIMIAFCLVYPLCIKFIFRCDIKMLNRAELTSALGEEKQKLTLKQWIPLLAFLLIAVQSFTYPYWPDLPVISNIKGMDTVIFTSVILAVLALIRVNGEQIFQPVEAFSKGVNWPIVMAVASMACIGTQLVSDEYGVKAWLTRILGNLFSSSNPVLFIVITVVITLIITNIFSNPATLLVISALVATLCGPLVEAGYDITILAVIICMTSQVAYLTYASSGQAAILLNRDNIDNKTVWTYGLCAMGIYAVITIAAGVAFLVI